MQYFNQLNSSHQLYDSESFTDSKFDAKNAKAVKSTKQIRVSNLMKCLEKWNTRIKRRYSKTS